MADINPQIIEPYASIPFIPLNDVGSESRHGANLFSNVKQFAAGFGSKVFRVDRDGLWLGAETFADAPFSVDMEGNVTLTSLSALTGFTDADLTSVALPTNGIRVDANGIYGRDSGVTTFSIDTSGNAYFSGDIAASDITGTTITGGTIQTATTGYRLVMSGDNNAYEFRSGATLLCSLVADIVPNSGTAGAYLYHPTDNAYLGVSGSAGAGWAGLGGSGGYFAVVSTISASHVETDLDIYVDGVIRLYESVGSNYISIEAPSLGSNWTLTLPTTNGSSGQYLQTDGSGNTTWATVSVSGFADTDLNNLTTTSINQSLIPEGATQDLGSSSLPWDRGYIDDIYLTNGDGGIYYNAVLSLDFYAAHIRLGSSMDDFSPASALGANLGDTFRWNSVFCDALDVNGTVDAASLRFSTGEDITGNGSDIDYDADTDHVFYINSVLKAIIDDNIFTEGDLLANGSKPFLIPHPDGSDRLLRYTAQESPEVILRHRGVATTNRSGEVEITLPAHFTAVTDAKGLVTVNLTPVGDWRVFLQQAPSNSTIKVGSSDPNVEFHYEVMAIRDGYLDAPVELEEGDGTGMVEKMRAVPAKTAAIKARKAAYRKKIQEKAAPEVDNSKRSHQL